MGQSTAVHIIDPGDEFWLKSGVNEVTVTGVTAKDEGGVDVVLDPQRQADNQKRR